ncbi:hypothetical protein PPL_08351 [Heterostelium album PN500]|uniref:B box-type domain-containing protein n=1 Tax=Heterostelium pallidum (strain ATCC 26659 / Pp 5 / PN500) TaxID=670386 RepID=D3BHY3_HETP5|nr:hypothetical protein PPL_08351 [Heterostelium album PN500]EFA78883.1 hypothetical protein PPL_08351 [Heterostelium album PN500]|eukprot:XP_020431007.1 hypothetical protein PPL_08351 [Heterostelium album PN500]
MTQCIEHNKDLDLLCTVCNVIICYRCLVSKHNEHHTLHIDDIKQSLLNIDYSVVIDKNKKEKNNNNDNNNEDDKDQDKDIIDIDKIKDDNNKNDDKDNNSNSNYNNDMIKMRIEWLWEKVNNTVNHIQTLTEMENEISNHFKRYYEMLMKEESKLKKPFTDEIEKTKQQLDKLIKEIQSLHNIIQSITPTLKSHEKDSNDLDNNNIKDDNGILSDSTINYSLETLIESIEQSKSLEQFIHNNSNTIFNIQQQNNNEIIEYLKNNNEINKNKRHKNNDNNKTDNNNLQDYSILEIIRNHINNHRINDKDLEHMNCGDVSVSESSKHLGYFDGIRHFIQKSIDVEFYLKQPNNNRYIIATDEEDDLNITFYKCKFESRNQLELMEKESNELAGLIDSFTNQIIIFASSNTTIYIFFIFSFVAYSMIDGAFRVVEFQSSSHLARFLGQPTSYYVDPFYIYFYGRTLKGTMIVRFNTMLGEFEHLYSDSQLNITPVAIFNEFYDPEMHRYTIHYDSQSKQIVLVLYVSFSTIVKRTLSIVHDVVSPKYISYLFRGEKMVYIYYGDGKLDYFLHVNFNLAPLKLEIKKLDAIGGCAIPDAQNNELLVLPPIIYNEEKHDEKMYLFTKDESFVYSQKGRQWKKSHIKTTNIKFITDTKDYL